MLAEERCNRSLVEFAGRDPQNESLKLVIVSIKVEAIEIEKEHCRQQSGPLVAVDEGLALSYVIQIGRGHFGQVLVKELAAEHAAWLRHR